MAISPDPPAQCAVELLRELLNSLPESSLPPAGPSGVEEEWRKQPTAIEQLRQFLLACP